MTSADDKHEIDMPKLLACAHRLSDLMKLPPVGDGELGDKIKEILKERQILTLVDELLIVEREAAQLLLSRLQQWMIHRSGKSYFDVPDYDYASLEAETEIALFGKIAPPPLFTIIFPEGYYSATEKEAQEKGYLPVAVKLADGRRFALAFYDLVRLKEILDERVTQGVVHYADPNLVVLSVVTSENVGKAISALYRDGFFDRLQPEPAPASE